MATLYLDYVGLRVTQLPRAVRFFTRGLGLKEVRRGTMHHGGVWVLLHDPVSHQHVELNYYPKGNPYATPFQPGEGLDHVAFRTDDMTEARRRLRAAGARRVERFAWRGRVFVEYYEGPDGIWIELIAP